MGLLSRKSQSYICSARSRLANNFCHIHPSQEGPHHHLGPSLWTDPATSAPRGAREVRGAEFCAEAS